MRSSRTAALFTAAALVCLTAALAMAEPNNLTPQERANLEAAGLLNAGSEGAGPVYYVAPGVKVRETIIPLHVTSTTASGLRNSLMSSRPFQTNACAQINGPLVNGGFEDGTFNGWTTAGAEGSLNASACGTAKPAEASITNPGPIVKANSDPLIDYVYQNNHACMLGDSIPWGSNPASQSKCNTVSQSVVIPAGTANFNFAYAVLASNPGHGVGQDPYFEVRVDDLTDAINLYDVIDYTTNAANNCTPWCLGGFDPIGGANIVYRRWTLVTLNLTGVAGHTVKVSLKSSDCSPSAHFGEAFLDGGSISCPDSIAPSAVTLNASCAPDSGTSCTSFCATLTWDAPSDQSFCADSVGNCVANAVAANAYDIRWSTSPILTSADFAAATQASGEPAPAAAGTPESFQICGLPSGNVYFALQSSDQSFNTSTVATATSDCECNRPPSCDSAAACVASLWPPNHKYVPVTICGVTDPDGDPITITVTGITQDEPLNTRGDGNTCPDGQIVNGQASVRAERTGTPGIPGNGRVYAIAFTASDGRGGSCNGTVNVCVPHDQGQHSTCIDDGQKYNSLGPCNSGNQLVPDAVALTVDAPAGGQATMEFAVPAEMPVELSVFDVTGRRLALVENSVLQPGVYQRSWDMSGVAKGMYFVRLRAGSVTINKTMVNLH